MLKWQKEPDKPCKNVWSAKIGDIQFFSLWYNNLNDARPWKLTTQLPMKEPFQTWFFKSKSNAMECADKILSNWMRAVGLKPGKTIRRMR